MSLNFTIHSNFTPQFRTAALSFTAMQIHLVPKSLKKPQNATFKQTRRVVPKAQAASVVPYGLLFFCSVRGKKEIVKQFVLKQFLWVESKNSLPL